MFENKTFETLLEEKLDNVPDEYDKREGSVIYNALAPNSLEMQHLYMVLGWMYDQLNPRTADFDHLKRWALPFGFIPHGAEPCVIRGEFNMPIENGKRFNWNDVNFVMVNASKNELVAEKMGALTIKAGDLLAPIDPINDLTVSKVAEVLLPGRDSEDVETFRNRVDIEKDRQAYGGNIADYERMASSLVGVGNIIVKPTANGPGTVGLIIVDSDYNAPSDELVQRVQEVIDPPGYSGQGKGLAPIDHKVTVTGALKDTIDIVLHLTYAPGYTWDNAQTIVKDTIEAYFKSVRQGWKKDERLIIYISQIESKLLSLDSIVDIGHTQLNSVEENYNVKTDSVPVVGSVVAS